MGKRWGWIAIGIVVVSVATLGGALAYHQKNANPSHSDDHAETDGASNTVAPLGHSLLVRGYVIDSSSATTGKRNSFTGTLQPRFQSVVGFRIGGKISERLVEVGERVSVGQLLYRLDSVDADLQLRVAEADHQSAQSQYDQSKAEEARMVELANNRTASRSEYDMAVAARDISKARLNAAVERLELARNQRQYCDLKADTDGLITQIDAESGQVVSIGQGVLKMMQGNELEVLVSIPEGLVSEFKGHSAQASFWSHPELKIQAELRELSPMADPISRTYDARFRLIDALPDLSIGMTATIHLTALESAGLAVPLTAIANRGSMPAVWKVNTLTGGVQLIPIEVLQFRSETALVRGDLQAGDTIISAGVQRIDEQSVVRIWK